jgi:hypothetical protein
MIKKGQRATGEFNLTTAKNCRQNSNLQLSPQGTSYRRITCLRHLLFFKRRATINLRRFRHCFTGWVTQVYGIFFFKGDNQYTHSHSFLLYQSELPGIASEAGLEPATRSSAYLRHLNIL